MLDCLRVGNGQVENAALQVKRGLVAGAPNGVAAGLLEFGVRISFQEWAVREDERRFAFGTNGSGDEFLDFWAGRNALCLIHWLGRWVGSRFGVGFWFRFRIGPRFRFGVPVILKRGKEFR